MVTIYTHYFSFDTIHPAAAIAVAKPDHYSGVLSVEIDHMEKEGFWLTEDLQFAKMPSQDKYWIPPSSIRCIVKGSVE